MARLAAVLGAGVDPYPVHDVLALVDEGGGGGPVRGYLPQCAGTAQVRYVTGVLIRMVMRSWPVIREHGLGSGGGLLFWETCFMTVSNDRRKQ